MELHGVTALVLGLKRSGVGAVRLLKGAGAIVRGMDASADLKPQMDALEVPFSLQDEANIGYLGADPELLVVSPGVPLDLPIVITARERGVHVIGEVELAGYLLKGPTIGITGSNGKTTTTALTGHILEECGILSQVGGNIGKAVSDLVDSSYPDQWNVLELSSFQLESTETFHVKIAACLNVTPDHLDRHHSMEEYAEAKGRLFRTQTENDFAVLNYDDEFCHRYAAHSDARVAWFSSTREVPAGAWLADGVLIFEGKPFLSRSQIKLRGIHNVENVLAATLICQLAGAPLADIAAAVQSFPGVEHRLEFVRDVNGVSYFNDSKATNVDAAVKAVEAFSEPLWIIVGGKDKGASYAPLAAALHRSGRAALLIGAEPPYAYAAGPKITAELSGLLPVVPCGTIEAAVAYAHRHAQPGDAALLAPACASFDQFESYEQRGRVFKRLVEGL